MDIKKELEIKVTRLQDINQHLRDLEKKIGALQEEGRAIHSQGLEAKGAIDMLLQLQAKEEEGLKNSKTAGLILPEGVKPVIPEPEKTVEKAVPQEAGDVLETAEGAIPVKPIELEVR